MEEHRRAFIGEDEAVAGALKKAVADGGFEPGLGKLLAGFATTRVEGGNKRDTLTVGYDYNLSRRTDVYANVMHDKITTFTGGTSYAVGMRHKF